MTTRPEHAAASSDQLDGKAPAISAWKPKRAIAVVSPYDMVLDYELYRWTPQDYALYMTRTPYLDLPVTVEMVSKVSAPGIIEEVARTVLVPEPDVALYACTSGSFCRGAQAERDLAKSLSRGAHAPAYTTSGAVVEALQVLNAHSISLVTPYTADITALFVKYLGEFGISVVHSQSLEKQSRIWEIEPNTAMRMLQEADCPEAETLVISCTNFPTYDIIPAAENYFGKPVISANEASMWAAVGLAGGQIRGEGKLAHIPFSNTMAQSTVARRQTHDSQPIDGRHDEGE